MLVQPRRDSGAALRLMRKLLKNQGFAPRLLVTDKLRSYGSAFRRLRLTCPHEQGLRSRVDDWRGGRRFARLYCFRQLSPMPVSQFAP
jgi:transposase-like protein